MTRHRIAAISCCVAVCGLGGCSLVQPAAGGESGGIASDKANDSAPDGGEAAGEKSPLSLPGDTLVMRFVEHTGRAQVEGDLPTAWRAITGHPQRELLPYGHLSGARAYRAVQMAFADTDLDRYATRGDDADEERAPRPVRRVDPVWNRTRAVYQSRQALYVPAGAAQSYRVKLPTGARLETALGLLSPDDAPARFRITVDGRPLLDEVVTIPGKWFTRAADLPGAATGHESVVRFSMEAVRGAAKPPKAATAPRAIAAVPGSAAQPGTTGAPKPATPTRPAAPATVDGFFADPILWARGGGAPGPNVVFILLDTLRADGVAVMPRLDAFAAKNARFDQAITGAAWTRPSMLAMYGGDTPTAVGQTAEKMVPDESERKRFYRLAPALIPKVLAAHGYRVSAIGNNFFLLGYPAIGLDFGFEEVDDVRHPVKDTPAITRAAVRYLEQNRDRSFFLHLHYDATHWPYTPPEQYLDKSVIGRWHGDPALQRDPYWRRYLGEAAYADDNVGQVLDAIARLGLDKRTLVVIVGDHGEIFDPRHDHVVEALGFRTVHHHGWAAYDELLHVPLVLALPGAIAPVEVGAQVRLFDLAPTILDYLGVSDVLLPGRGRSLRPLIEQRESEERIAFTEGQDIRAVRGGGWVYLRREDPRLTVHGIPRKVPEELYDLAADPLEHANLADSDPAALARMRALFEREAPLSPDIPAIVYHLRAAPDAHPHRVDGTLTSDGRLAVRGVIGAGAEVVATDEHHLRLHLPGPGGVDFSVEPPDSPLTLTLTRDGQEVEPRRVLAGEFALPVLDVDAGQPLDPEHLRRLDARRAPQLGNRGDLMLWRDPGTPEAPDASGHGSDTDEVTGMMERWGYAHPPGARPEPGAATHAAPADDRSAPPPPLDVGAPHEAKPPAPPPR